MSGQQGEGSGGAINIAQLPLEQLEELRKQLQFEVQNLSAAYESLRGVHSRFVSNREVLGEYKKVCEAAASNEQKPQEALVCISSALYVMGEIVPSDRVLVDVGTDYFVEKPMDAAATYFTGRAEAVQENMNSIEQKLRVKQGQLGKVVDTMRARQAQLQQQQQQQAQTVA
ncbi:prefoldin, putative [Trypanosoma equiperdum]|uniref:Prefoldin, putative n=2 Tax=Trypanozoon TaxID=39700 RepID=Q57XL5_TRYB2|nr:prefoldin, putative [Trypanosoma brucei brucei TREU927]AAX69654.1 prefoldin, putative [Trypanosoma brucei]AAZ12323.1 prefoldin, putative [Trypanosoma brucei brucei TREU927]SCU67868.1 prefoldin, putative [Trypanosoma equiperdum]